MDRQALIADITAVINRHLGGTIDISDEVAAEVNATLASPITTSAPKTITVGKMHNGQWLTMEVDPTATTWKVNGWKPADRPPEIEQKAPAPVPDFVPLHDALAEWMKEQSPFMVWLGKYFETSVKGQTPTKLNGNQLHVSAIEGEVMLRRLHNSAVAAQDANGFKLSCQDAKGCHGGRRDCPVREALALLSTQPDFPLRMVKERKGPVGNLYAYDGFGA